MISSNVPALDISKDAYDAEKLERTFKNLFSVFNKNVKSEDVIAEAKERVVPQQKGVASSPTKTEAAADKTAIDVGMPDFTHDAINTQGLLDFIMRKQRGSNTVVVNIQRKMEQRCRKNLKKFKSVRKNGG